MCALTREEWETKQAGRKSSPRGVPEGTPNLPMPGLGLSPGCRDEQDICLPTAGKQTPTPMATVAPEGRTRLGGTAEGQPAPSEVAGGGGAGNQLHGLTSEQREQELARGREEIAPSRERQARELQKPLLLQIPLWPSGPAFLWSPPCQGGRESSGQTRGSFQTITYFKR